MFLPSDYQELLWILNLVRIGFTHTIRPSFYDFYTWSWLAVIRGQVYTAVSILAGLMPILLNWEIWRSFYCSDLSLSKWFELHFVLY